MANLKFKARLIERFGGQIRASKALKITERRLSRLIHRIDKPSPRELEIFREQLGEDIVFSFEEPAVPRPAA